MLLTLHFILPSPLYTEAAPPGHHGGSWQFSLAGEAAGSALRSQEAARTHCAQRDGAGTPQTRGKQQTKPAQSTGASVAWLAPGSLRSSTCGNFCQQLIWVFSGCENHQASLDPKCRHCSWLPRHRWHRQSAIQTLSGVGSSHSSVRVHRRMSQASMKRGVCQKGQKASKEVNVTSVAAGGARPSLRT